MQDRTKNTLFCGRLAVVIGALLVSGVATDANAHLWNEVPVLTRWVHESEVVCVVDVVGRQEAAPMERRILRLEATAGDINQGLRCPNAAFDIAAEPHHLTADGPMLIFAGAPGKDDPPPLNNVALVVRFDHPLLAEWPLQNPEVLETIRRLLVKKDTAPWDALQPLLTSASEPARAAVFASLRLDPAYERLQPQVTFCGAARQAFAGQQPSMRTATAFSMWAASQRASLRAAQCIEQLLEPIGEQCQTKTDPNERLMCEGAGRALTLAALRLLPQPQRMSWLGLCQSHGFERLCDAIQRRR